MLLSLIRDLQQSIAREPSAPSIPTPTYQSSPAGGHAPTPPTPAPRTMPVSKQPDLLRWKFYVFVTFVSVIWWSWTPLSSEACVSFCAWWHCDNQILIFYLQSHHSECIRWPNFLYPLHSADCCVHSLSFISPPPKAIHLFLPPLFLFLTLVSLPPHSSQIKSDWQYFISFQVYSIARQYFCTWHGYH